MEKLTEFEAFKWIETPTTKKRTERSGGHFVDELVPPGFEGYLKIFHAIYEDLSITDHTLSWHDLEGPTIRRLFPGDERTQELLKGSVVTHGAPSGPFPKERIRWRELAERCGLIFHPEINDSSFSRQFTGRSWPRYLVGPSEGYLDSASFCAFVNTLAALSGDQDCYFYFDVMATKDYTSPLLFRGQIAEAVSVVAVADTQDTPTYWWPPDHSWCLCTDHDLPFSIFGGNARVLAALEEQPELEVTRVTLLHRVDYKADRVNEKRDA